MRAMLGTNPRCRRLAPLPEGLVALVDGAPDVEQIRAAATAGGLSKFFDVNLTQLLRDDPLRDTLEVRMLPGAATAEDIVSRASVVEALLDRCCSGERFPGPPDSFADQLRDLRALVAAPLRTVTTGSVGSPRTTEAVVSRP